MINKEIGKRIERLRTDAGLTQQDLSERLKIKRPTVSQIEKGERKLKPEEIIMLSKIFNVNIDYILKGSGEPEIIIKPSAKKKIKKQDLRINIPRKNLLKFKEVLLYILREVGSKPNMGETVIYKLLYYIDFNYYELYEEQLIGATYIKNNYGPTPIEFKNVVKQMIKEGSLEPVQSKYFKYPQKKYLPRKEPDLSILNGQELELIDRVLDKLSDMNAAQISEYSHNDVPWLAAKDGGKIEYESVFYRTPEYSVRKYKD
ncbi:DUF4065 domain-containing protein [Candidatus Dependentiae bacterium]|nr:DUF4065 domain-containing protein [Candidatus Dependentiae bacterium]